MQSDTTYSDAGINLESGLVEAQKRLQSEYKAANNVVAVNQTEIKSSQPAVSQEQINHHFSEQTKELEQARYQIKVAQTETQRVLSRQKQLVAAYNHLRKELNENKQTKAGW